MKIGEAELAEVDAYLGAPKTLVDALPGWTMAFGTEFSARWGVLDADGAQVAELVFKCRASLRWPSLTLLHRRRLIHRTDLVPPTERKPNPISASRLGLPPIVTGSHMHRWPENREHVKLAGFGELPNRTPTPTALRTFEQALAATCDELNIHLKPEQRAFELPAQGDLF